MNKWVMPRWVFMSKHVDGIFSIPPLMFKHVGVAVCKYLKCGRHCYHFCTSLYLIVGNFEEIKTPPRICVSCAWHSSASCSLWPGCHLLWCFSCSLAFWKGTEWRNQPYTIDVREHGWVKLAENKAVSCWPEVKTFWVQLWVSSQGWTYLSSASSSNRVFCLWGLGSSSDR